MSGDVQPRKRKDKKKKKDDLGVEEPRGTAAALGEGDVFMHSYHDHGTGGHWCAKIIFFSLLAVLVTLIGLIILENRGLTELEANSVESRYSGVLEGWIEDAVDDHHDEHTLELKHHGDDENHPDDQVDGNESEEESLEEELDHDDDGHESDEDEDVSHEIEDDEEDETQHDDDEEDETQHDDDEEDETQHDDDEEDETQHDDDEEDETQNDDDEEEDEMQNDEDERQDDGNEEDEIENDDDEDETQNDDDEDGESQNDDDEGYDEDSDDHENLKDADHEDDEEEIYERYTYEEISKTNNIDDDDDEQKDDYLSKEVSYNYHGSDENGDDDESNENKTEDEEDDQGDDDDDEEEEIEKIEKEIIDDDDDDSEEITDKDKRDASKEDVEDTLNKDDGDEPPVEKISRPRDGKPFIEIEEETPVKPVDTLADEEAYERQQEELRRQEEETPQSLWLKLCVGGALLAATHALVRRAARNDPPDTEETVREETPSLTDRRMTIIDEQISVTQTPPSQAPRQIVDEEVFKRPAPVVQSAPIAKPKLEEEIVKEVVAKVLEIPKTDSKKEEEKELYSEEEEDEEEDVEEDSEVPQKAPPKQQEEESEPEPEEVSDVEIIYDETVEEEEIPEEDIEEEEISDVDDTELLSRLEAKYGRLPEPERPGQYKGGGNSLEAEWAGEPSDPYWRSQLDTAEEEFRQGAWGAAADRAGGEGLKRSSRARWLRARALDRAAEQKRDNRVLSEAIAAYLHLLEMNDALSDERLLEVARRAIDRIQFRGTYLSAEPVYRLLIRRFPDDVNYRNNLTISFLMANRADLADEVLRETLRLWPNDRVALAHHGFVLKTHYNKLEEAVDALRRALEGDAGRANEPRFYYHLGDALLMLGRFDEAHEVHKRGAKLGHFLSPAQRSLYNVPRLRSRPWWRVEDTPYIELARALERSWRDILKEGEAAVALYEQEKEGLRERGEWSQLDIFVRGREVGGRCASAPAVCAAVRGAGAAAGCRRGQVKFSMMAAGTHVRPHVGPTNCRLRMHLALSNTEGTYLRVDKEIRQWQVGKTLLFDDSFEHEVWHNGTGTRLVLIVDVWHPDLTAAERRQLPAI